MYSPSYLLMYSKSCIFYRKKSLKLYDNFSSDVLLPALPLDPSHCWTSDFRPLDTLAWP